MHSKRNTSAVLVLICLAFGGGLASGWYDLAPRRWLTGTTAPTSESTPSTKAAPAGRSAVDYAQIVGRSADEISWPVDTGHGMFHRAPRSDTPPSAAEEELQQLAADTPYLNALEAAPDRDGVTRFDADRAHDGLNLVLSAHAPEATLRTMKGEVLHAWSLPMEQVWSKPLGFYEWPAHETFWRRVHAFPNGDLLAIFEGIGMIRIDAESNLLWEHKGRCHHDMDVDAAGRIYTLARQDTEDSALGRPILEDHILVLDGNGQELQRFSLLEALVRSPYAELARKAPPIPDVLHTNTIELLDDRWSDRLPSFRSGSVLVSMRNIDSIAVVDLERGEITWALTGMWRRQHQPTVLDNGNLLLFDNSGFFGKSQILEFDPATQKLAWWYRGTPQAPFDSWHSGSSQRLPNGNTLISESVRGRAFEVTPTGDVVWEFVNPNRGGAQDGLIAVLSEVVRIEWSHLQLDAVRDARSGLATPIEDSGVQQLLGPERR